VGDDPDLRRTVRNTVVHGEVKNLSWSNLPDVVFEVKPNFLLVIEMKAFDRQKEEYLVNLLDLLTCTSPLFYFSNASGIREPGSTLLIKVFEEIGAKVFVGKLGKKLLLDFLSQTADRDPAEIITSLRLSDSGLTVVFADSAVATIAFADLRRIAETNEIVLNDVRIAGDRSYITVGTKDEAVPIPFDIIREYVATDKPQRQMKTVQQNRLTAKNVGERIRELRERAGASQKDLAAKTATSRWTIMRIEKGLYLPKVSMMEKIARALHLNIEELLVS
jgi:DNA-binding XRE family transcriptional regulator